jgi:hypothetical protein
MERSATNPSEKSARRTLAWLIPLVMLSMLAREGIAYITWGSFDATQFQEFGRQVAMHGIVNLYRIDPMYNHPPALGCVCAIVYRITHDRLDQPDTKSAHHVGWTFPFVFKQLNIVSDLIACGLIWKVLRPRAGPGGAALATVLFAWSPLSVVQTGYHGNDDHVYAMLCLLAVYLIEDRAKDFWGGVALAAAINVKLIPVLLIAPLLCCYRDRGRAVRFLAGLALGIIPFLCIIIPAPAEFSRNVLHYGSMVGNWGVQQLLQDALREPRFSAVAQALIETYYTRGRWLILAAIVLLSLRAWRDPKIDRYDVAACALCLFLIIAPAFAIHYLVIPLPLMFATRRLLPATMYGLLAGILCFFTAWQNWLGSWPIESDTLIGPVAPGPLFGLLAWATLVYFTFTQLWPRCYNHPHEPSKGTSR